MNNPSAFPRPASEAHLHGMYSAQEGMTLRDYFAAKAMQGAIAGMSTRRDSFSYKECAALCYEMANTMLKAREQ